MVSWAPRNAVTLVKKSLLPNRSENSWPRSLTVREREEEEERCNGISTELVLLFDPYKIKKKLTKSDLGHQSRLLILRARMTTHVLPGMSEEMETQVMSGEGANVVVWDADTRWEHQLVFSFWASSGAYVLKRCWIKEFVQRRGLAARDEIGIYWDPTTNRFHFSLLCKANQT
ncbi:hypothetical protein EUGRSUZ_E02013 [Eucalyptus grandis]|uniref:TF-B3 domain-containing protein n=2 Tax=Eucalyptus grandis TaxID=71139 RepID=A0A059C5R9_EUCGR|nr:hypothetical protein EUGRSUZ_E02013 [Eucalyptus grandis]